MITADTTLLAYAELMAGDRAWPVVFDDTVRPGLVVVDPKLEHIAVHPCAPRYTLRQNGSDTLPSNDAKP